MLQFIKKLFGFGKKEVKTDVFVTTENTTTEPVKTFTIPVDGKIKEEAEQALAEVIASHKEEIKFEFDEKSGEVIFTKPKEELEKVISERISEIEAKKEIAVEKVVVTEKKTSKPKTTPAPKKEGEKKPVEKKQTSPKKPKEEKAPVEKKPTPAKKDTKKGKN